MNNLKRILAKTFNSLKSFILKFYVNSKNRKRNLITTVVIFAVLISGTYLMTHHFKGNFSIVSSVDQQGKYYVLTTDDSKKINLSKNGKLKVPKFYRLSGENKYSVVSYATFKTDLKSYRVSVRRDLNNDLQYKIEGSNGVADSSSTSIRLSIKDNTIKVSPIDKEPKKDSLFVDLITGKVLDSNDSSSSSLEVTLTQNQEIDIVIPDNDKEILPTVVANLQKSLEDAYDFKSIDSLTK